MLDVSLPEIRSSLVKSLDRITKNYSVDYIIYVLRNGVYPGMISQSILDLPLDEIALRKYSDTFPPKPLYDKPRLFQPFQLDLNKKIVLVVDDITVTGDTLSTAQDLVRKQGADQIITLTYAKKPNAINSTDHFSCITTKECVNWPWVK